MKISINKKELKKIKLKEKIIYNIKEVLILICIFLLAIIITVIFNGRF
jgi:hypothetical protein